MESAAGDRGRRRLRWGNQNADATGDGQIDNGGHRKGKTEAWFIAPEHSPPSPSNRQGTSAFYFPLNVTIYVSVRAGAALAAAESRDQSRAGVNVKGVMCSLLHLKHLALAK